MFFLLARLSRGFAVGVLVALAVLPAQSPGPRSAASTVRVVGRATASNPDRVNASRLDAMQQAIQQAGGTQVRSHAIVKFNELVGQFTYTQASAVVGSVQPLGPASIEGGVFVQPYAIEVHSDALNRELVENKIDVEFLYDLVLRPRIAVSILDQWNPSADLGQPAQVELGSYSNQQIIAHFMQRHPGFVFKELNLLRSSASDEVDYVREARNNSFDLLILGTTRASLRRAGPAPAPRPAALPGGVVGLGGQPDTLAKLQAFAPPTQRERMEFNAQLDWRVINVSTAETILVVSGQRVPREGEFADVASDANLASRASKLALLNEKVPELFRELLHHWNRRLQRESYTVAFTGIGTANPLELESQLRASGGLLAPSIKLDGAVQGRTTFSGQATLARSELANALSAAFAGRYTVRGIRPGFIELEAVGGTNVRTLTVAIANISLTDAKTVQSALEVTPGIVSVQRQAFSGGRVTFNLVSSLTDDEIGERVERAIPGKIAITALAPGNIEAKSTATN